MADADDQCIGQFVFEDVHQRQCGFVVELVGGFVKEQDLRFVQQGSGKAEPLLFDVGQDFFDRMAAYGVSDGIFTFMEQAVRDVLPALR